MSAFPAASAAPPRGDWRSWREPAALAAIVALTGLCYWPTTESLLREWFTVPSSAYKHGALIVLIAVWLSVRAIRAHEGRAQSDAQSVLPLLALAALSIAWLIARRAGIQVAHQALLPLIVWVNVRLLLGRRIAALTLVPLGLVFSAIPVWHVAVPALQSMTVSVVSTLLHASGIPAYVAGDFVHIRSGVFHIENGCAGLHYFIVAATIAVLYGELRADRWGVRACLLGIAVMLALISNWLRVLVIIVAGHLTNMQGYLVRVDHAAFGWMLFALAMIVFLLLARLWPLNESPSPAACTAEDQWPVWAARRVPWLAAAALAAALGPAWSLLAPVRAATMRNVSMPLAIPGWSGPAERCQGLWRPQFPSADLHAQGEFSRGSQAVCLYLATFLSQHQDKELIGYWSSVYAPDSEIVSATVREANGRAINEVQLGDEIAADRIVWYAYVVGERELRRGVSAQLMYALGTLHGAPAASVYAISTSCVPDCAAGRRLLAEFLPHVRVGHGGAS